MRIALHGTLRIVIFIFLHFNNTAVRIIASSILLSPLKFTAHFRNKTTRKVPHHFVINHRSNGAIIDDLNNYHC